MTARELREKRANLIEQNKELTDRAEAEDRAFTDEETVEYDKRFADVGALKDRYDRIERDETLQKELDAVPAPVSPPDNRTAEPRTVSAEDRASVYNKWFRKDLNFTDAERRALQDTTDTAGGYLHPDSMWVGELIQNVDNMTIARSLGQRIFQVPNADSLGAPSLATDIGDLTWTSELLIGSEDSSLAFNRRELSPHPLARYIDVSRTLLRKAVLSPEALVRERLAYKFAAVMEANFFTGTGASQPLGVMTASDMGISTSRDVSTGNAATALGADNLRECTYSLKPQYRKNAKWIWHRDGVKKISLLKDGDGQYLWRPGITANDPDTILGLPVIESEYQNSTFTSALYVGILGDFTNYWWADSLNLEIQRLDEIVSATNEVRFVARGEFDGAPVVEEAFVRSKMGT